MSPQTILHPTDFSPYAERAFDAACSLARHYGARVVVVHASAVAAAGYGTATVPPPEGDWSVLEHQIAQVRPKDESVRVEHRLVLGTPPEEIIRVAAEIHADLIVMGTHGRTGLSRALMGSVAEEVVRKAPCSVLVVKTPHGAA
ncbi:MAG TPA: universal stress protein [Pirellulales bacterium]|nr:universal stress protein [Pirellulales bacterium]